jgi:hypothetical protein
MYRLGKWVWTPGTRILLTAAIVYLYCYIIQNKQKIHFKHVIDLSSVVFSLID